MDVVLTADVEHVEHREDVALIFSCGISPIVNDVHRIYMVVSIVMGLPKIDG